MDALCDAIDALKPDDVQNIALEIDDHRREVDLAALMHHHGVADAKLLQTPFELQAATMAYEEGVLAWDRTERYFLRPSTQDIHPDLSPEDYDVRLVGGKLHAPSMWPFREDAPLADFERGTLRRWWSHGLTHTLMGFAYWPSLTEMDLIHVSRFAESVAVWHWYWLCDLGREHCPQHQGRMGIDHGSCPDCARLDAFTNDLPTRALRISSAFGDWLAHSGLAFLRNETHAMRYGFTEGRPYAPPFGTGLDMGEACEYALWHHRRMRGKAFGRWLDHCTSPGHDYARSPEEFAAHARRMIDRLLRWQVPVGPLVARRARRVLQDVGYRLCQASANAGSNDRHQEALEQLGDAVARLLAGPDDGEAEDLLAETLSQCAVSWEGEAPGPEREGVRLFALGYRPTTRPDSEPAAIRSARAEAVRRIMSSMGWPPLFWALADRLAEADRRPHEMAQDALDAANHLGLADYTMLAGWWLGIDAQLQLDPRISREVHWDFRYSLRKLPPQEDWARYRADHFVGLVEVGGIFSERWLEALFAGTAAMPPELAGPGQPAGSVLAGVTPEGPLVLPLVGAFADVYRLAAGRPTLAELVAATSVAAVDEALKRRAVAAVWAP